MASDADGPTESSHLNLSGGRGNTSGKARSQKKKKK